MTKINIAGLNVDAITRPEFIAQISGRLATDKKTFVITPYSEFLYAALRDREVMNLLNSADVAIPDGIGLIWAERFLGLPFSFSNYYLKIIQALWQIVYSGAAILLRPNWVYKALPQKLVGADMVWEISKLAEQEQKSVYLLGGFGNTAEIVAKKLQTLNHRLKIAGWSNKNPNDPSTVEDINSAKADLLFVAYGPIRQEQWIEKNLAALNVKLAMGVGGTFDYIAGIKKQPPAFVRNIGLEWLYRLITQPYRFRRIVNATWGLIFEVLRYKVFMSLPYRNNVVSIIMNNEGHFLIFQRNPKDRSLYEIGETDRTKFVNYWQFTQGGIDRGEDVLAATVREVKEETGIQSITHIYTSKHRHRYLYRTSKKLFDNHFKFTGQEQTIVYFRFTGDNSEIVLDDEELVNYQWVDRKDLRSIIHPERWPIVEIIEKDLPVIIEKNA